MQRRVVVSRVWIAAAGMLAVTLASACSSDSPVTVSSTLSSDDDTAGTASGSDDTATGETSSDATSGATADTVTGADGPGSNDISRAFEPEPIEWDTLDGTDVATIEVPVDYADPDGERFELFLARHNARNPDERIGTLLVNPGGPGFGGSDLAFFAPQIYDSELLDRFDIIGWDPRGTGESDPPIDCIDDYDPYFTAVDSTPETPEQHDEIVEIAEDFAEECVTNNPTTIQHVGTNDSARDMDVIRRALDEDTISYFGFSYGSELGAAWATMFPETVRAAVLDGAADPNADSLESSKQQLAGFEGTLATFLAECSADAECEFHNGGDAEGAFDALTIELDENPIPAESGRPPVNRDVATTATIQAMYSESYWPSLERSLADAQDGDGSGLMALNDAYYQRSFDGTYGNELEAFQVIACADTTERLTVEETDAQAAELHEVAPRLVPEDVAGGYFCTFFPESLDPRVDITGAGAGPIVVIGTTGDPATPLESTRLMAEALEDGRLVVVEADQHTGYGVNSCVVDVVNDYLVDLEPPTGETECA